MAIFVAHTLASAAMRIVLSKAFHIEQAWNTTSYSVHLTGMVVVGPCTVGGGAATSPMCSSGHSLRASLRAKPARSEERTVSGKLHHEFGASARSTPRQNPENPGTRLASHGLTGEKARPVEHVAQIVCSCGHLNVRRGECAWPGRPSAPGAARQHLRALREAVIRRRILRSPWGCSELTGRALAGARELSGQLTRQEWRHTQLAIRALPERIRPRARSRSPSGFSGSSRASTSAS